MSETFLRIKKSAGREALYKSLALGLAVAMLLCGLLLLLNKLALPLPLPLLLIPGLLAGIAVFSVSYLLLKKSDKRLARHLDRTYHLNEAVETMIAFRDAEGELLPLQRQQAEEALRALSPPKSPLKHFWRSAAALLVSAAVLIGAVALPTKSAEEPSEDTPFAISSFQLGALRQLIDEVKATEAMTPSARVEITAELERLYTTLQSVTTQFRMKSEVIATIVSVDMLIENVNTFKLLAVALDEGMHDDAKALAASLIALNGICFGEDLVPLREHYRGAEATIALGALATDLTASLTAVVEEYARLAQDPLYLGLSQFAADLSAAAADQSGNENTVSALVDKAFAEAGDDVGCELSTQYANKTICLRVVDKLAEIFHIPEAEIPPLLVNTVPTLSTDQSGEGDEEDENENAGGYGEGNELFGSNDTIYHPFGENGAAHVPYGDAYGYYHRRIEDLLQYGNLDETTKQQLIDYFARLSDGSKG